MGRMDGWRAKVKAIKQEVVVIALAARDPRTSWAARMLILCIVGYALSPVDLIPDFIPVLGFLDEMLLLPAALILALRMIPPEAIADARSKADGQKLEASRTAAVVIVLIWLVCLVISARLAWPYLSA